MIFFFCGFWTEISSLYLYITTSLISPTCWQSAPDTVGPRTCCSLAVSAWATPASSTTPGTRQTPTAARYRTVSCRRRTSRRRLPRWRGRRPRAGRWPGRAAARATTTRSWSSVGKTGPSWGRTAGWRPPLSIRPRSALWQEHTAKNSNQGNLYKYLK